MLVPTPPLLGKGDVWFVTIILTVPETDLPTLARK